jgi:prophage DNA circulation protein
MRARQAEEMVKVLMADIPADVRTTAIVEKIKAHIELRELERSTQYLGILQTTLISLTAMQRRYPDDTQLIEVIKAITLATSG